MTYGIVDCRAQVRRLKEIKRHTGTAENGATQRINERPRKGPRETGED
jgi:hypothetical protein